MSGRLGSVMVGMVVVACVSQRAAAQRYAPGPVPQLLDDSALVTQTEDIPDPSSRTTVGIGEKVDCWIDPTTWQDIDNEVDSYGNVIGSVYDNMGDVDWSADLGTVVPVTGTSTTLTVSLAASAGANLNLTATVSALSQKRPKS